MVEKERHPLLSVIIPVFNGEKLLSDAIESILSQGYPNLEIIVIDDGSTDNTKEVAMSFKEEVCYHSQKNQGPAVARNTGIKKSKGQIIGFLDADDVWSEGRVELLMGKFQEDSNLQIVMGHTISKVLEGAKNIEPNLLKPHIIPVFGSALFKRSVFDKVGLIDESFWISEDQDWFMRAKEMKIPMKIIKDVVVIRRLHGDNMTNDTNWEKAGILKVLRKSIDRRRRDNKGKADELPKLSDYAGSE